MTVIHPTISLIVASAQNGVIGRHGGLPWYCPSDLQHFKRLTMGKAMIMGRTTWESIGKPLPGRVSIVISRMQGPVNERVAWVSSVEAAITAAQTHPLVEDTSEIMIIGGGQIYTAALPVAQRIYRTVIEADVEGDTQFAQLNNEWELVQTGETMQSEKDEFPMHMEQWEKLSS